MHILKYFKCICYYYISYSGNNTENNTDITKIAAYILQDAGQSS